MPETRHRHITQHQLVYQLYFGFNSLVKMINIFTSFAICVSQPDQPGLAMGS